MTQIPVDLDTRRRITFNIDYLPANSKLELKDNNNNIIGLPCNVTSEQTNYTYIVSEKVPTGTYTLEISLKNNLTDTYTIFNTTQIRVLKTSNDEVIRDLITYIPGCKKNANVYDLIAHAQEHAVKRAKQLEQHHAELGRKKNSMECNPSTDAYKALEIT